MTGIVGGPPAIAAARAKRLSWDELGPRVGSALVLMVVAIAATLAGGLWFSAVWLAAATVVFWEWQRLIGRASTLAGLVLGASSFTTAVALLAVTSVLAAVAALAVGAVLVGVLARHHRVLAGFGVLYAGLPLVALVLLRRSEPFGATAVFWLFAIVWGTDVMAYFGGRLVGGPKLSPRFSPSKTWSGFLIGIAAGSALGAAIAPSPKCLACLICLGLLAGATSQLGDIGESALKRRFGAKDSGALIPGHGGAMDRLDGFMAAACFAAALGALRFGVGAASRGLFQW